MRGLEAAALAAAAYFALRALRRRFRPPQRTILLQVRTPGGAAPRDDTQRTVVNADAMAWMRAQAAPFSGSVVTGIPDISEVSLSPDEYRAFFLEAVELILRRTPTDGVAVFCQTDCRIMAPPSADCAVHKKLASKSLSATATRATVVRDDPIGATVFLKNARTVAQVELRAASRTASSSYESSRGSSVRQSREKTVCLLSTHLEDEFANGGEGDVDGDARGRAGDASRGVGSVTRACGHRPALTRGVRDVREKFSKCTTSSREETAGDARRDARRCARKRRAE